MNSSIVKWILPFMIGILLKEWFPTNSEMLSITLSIVMAIGAGICTFLSYKHKVARNIYIIFFVLTAISIGYTIALLHSPLRNANHYIYYMNNGNMFEAVITDKPSHTPKCFKTTANITMVRTYNNGWKHTTGKAILYFHKDSLSETLQYGDKVVIKASLTEITPIPNSPDFDYKDYMEKRGIYGRAYIRSGNFAIIEQSSKNSMMTFANKLRDTMIGIIEGSELNEQEKGIAEAMLLGWDENIDDETFQRFSNAGISHILCVSGLHLGIISILVGYCLFFLSNSKRNRIIKGCVRIVVLWFFAMITGLAPSAMRAATMFSLIVIGEMISTRTNTFSNIATSAFILLLINPNYIYDVGFQLSYAAVIGIVTLKPFFDNFISIPQPKKHTEYYRCCCSSPSRGIDVLLNIWQKVDNVIYWLVKQILSVTYISIAAQIFTTPFLLYYFHRFPLYFLIANIAVVPFAGIILATALLMVICAGKVFVEVFSCEITAMNSVMNFVSGIPNATISDIYFDTPMFCISLFSILVLTLSINRRWKPYPYIFMISMIILVAYAIIMV